MFDVVVVGGGPAGAAAALTLTRYTDRRVCLCEATRYDTPRVGETVSAALLPLLDYLDVSHAVSPSSALAAHGNAAAWGGDDLLARDTIFGGQGHGWHLDRRLFDSELCSALERHGADRHLGADVRGIARDGDGWRLDILGSAGGEVVRARVAIDAGGRRATLSRRLGSERLVDDRLVGLVCYFETGGMDLERATLVEAVPEGWWYAAPLPGNRAVAALMTDADLLRRLEADTPKGFADRLAGTRHIAHRFRDARPEGRPRVHPAESHRLSSVCGPGWVAAGDAASAFDPLASLGIGHALASGIQAARVAHALLDGDSELHDAYPADVERHWQAYLDQSRSIYRAERRWLAAPFWARRQLDGWTA